MSVTGATVNGRPNGPRICVMWENFGPTHHDRTRALQAAGYRVTGIEILSKSPEYIWDGVTPDRVTMHTLFRGNRRPGAWRLATALFQACRKSGAREFLFCHYERPGVLLAAWALRLANRRVYTMADSKFDDYARKPWREALKRLFLTPYRGALVASHRSRDYFASLGIAADRIELGYNGIDIARLQKSAIYTDEPQFAERPFLIVARLVPKKNLSFAIAAYARYRERSGDRRPLNIAGYGPLRADLEKQVHGAGLDGSVRFLGTLASEEVAAEMRGALCLILPSHEEQYGLVVAEALAVGLPAIVSSNAGAVDTMLDDGRNGIVIDPTDLAMLTDAMVQVARDEGSWLAMRKHATESAERGDVAHFVRGVTRLTGRNATAAS